MKILCSVRATQELARSLGKPILYLQGFDEEWEEDDKPWNPDGTLKAVPFMNAIKDGLDDSYSTQAYVDGVAFVVCDTVEELDRLFDQVVGDEGPTRSNPYRGKYRVYALTIYANGETGAENT